MSHGDIKPENVMIDTTDNNGKLTAVSLVDFGGCNMCRTKVTLRHSTGLTGGGGGGGGLVGHKFIYSRGDNPHDADKMGLVILVLLLVASEEWYETVFERLQRRSYRQAIATAVHKSGIVCDAAPRRELELVFRRYIIDRDYRNVVSFGAIATELCLFL